MKHTKDNLRGVTFVRFIATASRETSQIDGAVFELIDGVTGPFNSRIFDDELSKIGRKVEIG